MEMNRLAVETCFWPIYEVEDGKWKLSRKPKEKIPVEEWLKPQGRFRHLFIPQNRYMIEELQKEVDKRWAELLERCGTKE
jgi:pyruvate ferredoxin oxidoreductase beta subunit